MNLTLVTAWVVSLLIWPLMCLQDSAQESDYTLAVRPLLARHCWKCHGPDAASRQADLRLDERASATAVLASGRRAIAPDAVEQSELLRRVVSADRQLRMPPPEAGSALTAGEISLLRRWIEAGAEFQQHWSFQPLVRQPVPVSAAAPAAWRDNPIDGFVYAGLAGKNRLPSERADWSTLVRRVWFDLTGMPPTEQELQRAEEQSWEQIVDECLQSPHFGERMAVEWLDMARYADTDGYFGDKPRQIWLYRDWLIQAFNRNLPYDQMTIEQLAGDLLPDATIQQRIATGFNRNHMSNDETGLIDEEFRLEYVADRTDTTMTVWLGLTAGCARCHDHKYDRLTQREYYQLSAFFNNVPERGLLVGSNAPPVLSVPSAEQQQRLAVLQRAASEANAAWMPQREAVRRQLEQRPPAVGDVPRLPEVPGSILVALDDEEDAAVMSVGTKVPRVRGIVGHAAQLDGTRHAEHAADGLPVDGPWTVGVWLQPEKSLNGVWSKIEPTGARRGVEVLWRKGRVLVNMVHRWNESAIEVVTREKQAGTGWQHLVVRWDGSGRATGLSIALNGVFVPLEIVRDSLSGTVVCAEPLRIGRRDEGLGFYGLLDEFRWVPQVMSDSQVSDWFRDERLRGILERRPADRTVNENDWLLDDWIDHEGSREVREARSAMRSAEAAVAELQSQIPLTLVMAERSAEEGRRPTHVLERGEYQRVGERVEPGVPAMIGGWSGDLPANRLGLARWLTTGAGHLAARVAVNRLWQQCFGAGLVRTPADFGTQGEPPELPDLLDWLACEYRDSGWDTKRLLKSIVMSQTYQQSSAVQSGRPGGGEVWDAENRWWSRGGRFRLPFEMLRDSRLRVSGLLQVQLGGPSVKPWQPPGLWEEVSYDGESTWETDGGAGRYRRSLYTFQKRQAPHPGLLLFDGPTREKCTVQRPRTNTPLQALQILNDPEVLQAARGVAERLMELSGERQRIGRMYRMVLSRTVRDDEMSAVSSALAEWRISYGADLQAVVDLLEASKAEAVEGQQGVVTGDSVELVVWTLLVQSLFSLDEAVMRR